MRKVLALTLLLAGCGGSSDDPAPVAAKRNPVQQIDRYSMTLTKPQKQRILPDDRNPIVGEWTMTLNRTLEIVDLLAPDGGGITLSVEEYTGARLVAEDVDNCPGEKLVFAVDRSSGLRLSHVSGRCPETNDLLTVNPWAAA